LSQRARGNGPSHSMTSSSALNRQGAMCVNSPGNNFLCGWLVPNDHNEAVRVTGFVREAKRRDGAEAEMARTCARLRFIGWRARRATRLPAPGRNRATPATGDPSAGRDPRSPRPGRGLDRRFPLRPGGRRASGTGPLASLVPLMSKKPRRGPAGLLDRFATGAEYWFFPGRGR